MKKCEWKGVEKLTRIGLKSFAWVYYIIKAVIVILFVLLISLSAGIGERLEFMLICFFPYALGYLKYVVVDLAIWFSMLCHSMLFTGK